MDNANNGLNKLLPKSIVAKRRRKKQATLDGDGHGDDDRGRRLSSRSTLESDETNSLSVADDEEESRSFASHESDAETSPTRPGAFSTHPSQIGYLTTSSPVVQASHLSESYSQIPDIESNDSASKSSAFPSERSDSVESKESRLGRSKTGLLPPHTLTRRSPSPGVRIKELFRSRKTSTSSAHTSPERRPSSDHRLPPDIGRLHQLQEQPTTTPEPEPVPEPPPSPPILEPPAAARIASPERRTRVQPRIDTTLPPRTPPAAEKPAPVIVNTPPTPVEEPESAHSSKRASWDPASPTLSANGHSPSQNISTHRRSRSASVTIGPSKLSNIISAPLSPALETGEPTPVPNSGSGFFSSMISVAQNAANTFSSNIQNNSIGIGGSKSRSVTSRTQDRPDLTEAGTDETVSAAETNRNMDQKESAVRTMGTGELSLSQLGLTEPANSLTAPSNSRFPDLIDTRARSESAPVESPIEPFHDDADDRPRSLYEATSGDQTPPTIDIVDGKPVQRTSSLRSAMKPHRKRGSSVTTATTIGAAIVAANSSLAQPNANASAPKLTGFAIASKKRNRDFHTLFKSVPDDDYLIEDYSCALQREILAHGRLYVSEGHLCFSSNILGWTTTLVMSFDEIVSVEKRSTALLFKNGLMISTLHAKHIFASFTSRDATYDLIVNIWKLGHPTLKSTLNGVQLEGTGGDKTEKVDSEPSGVESNVQDDSGSEEDSDDEDDDFYDEDLHEELHNASQAADAGATEPEMEKAVSRKPSAISPANGNAPVDTPAAAGGLVDFPGPATHAPTDCGDSATHYEKIVGDDVIPAPLGKVFSMIFGQASVTWMAQWITGDQKCTDLQMEDKKGLSLENRSRHFTYIKPLYASIGPKQTKCIVTETLENLDYEKAINLLVAVQNPDVPSGNVFSVKTKYCLSWAENNSTRVQINCTIEWTGKSWLKGPIEKGTNDGQTQYCKDLFAALKAAVSSRPRSNTAGNGAAKPTTRKKGKKGKGTSSPAGAVQDVAPKQEAKTDWGMLEPIRGIAEPVVDIVKPLLTGNVMYAILVGLLVATWFGFGPSRAGRDVGAYRPDRLAAYEEMWRREDTELWDWLEERVGLDRMHADRPASWKRAVEPRSVEEKLREERMNEREVEQAIRVTEEKLKVLRSVVERKQKNGARPDNEGVSEEEIRL